MSASTAPRVSRITVNRAMPAMSSGLMTIVAPSRSARRRRIEVVDPHVRQPMRRCALRQVTRDAAAADAAAQHDVVRVARQLQ